MNKEKVLLNLQKNNPLNLKIEKVIHLKTRRGDGTPENPVRIVDHYYDHEDGHLIFEIEN
ncbi:hypothetical protein [Paucilactobacillus sp. N302-9]